MKISSLGGGMFRVIDSLDDIYFEGVFRADGSCVESDCSGHGSSDPSTPWIPASPPPGWEPRQVDFEGRAGRAVLTPVEIWHRTSGDGVHSEGFVCRVPRREAEQQIEELRREDRDRGPWEPLVTYEIREPGEGNPLPAATTSRSPSGCDGRVFPARRGALDRSRT